MKRILFLISVIFTFVNIAAQPEIKKLTDYELTGDVSTVVVREYTGKMYFGELVTDNLIETDSYKFDTNKNLIEFELIKDDKHLKNKYTYNTKGKVTSISYLNGDHASFEYNANQLIKIDTYNKEGKLVNRVKRTYNTPNSFIDVKYNSNGKEINRSIYKNNLLVSEVSTHDQTDYIYNTRKQLVEQRYSGTKVDMGEVLSAFMMANALGDMDGLVNMKGQKVSSITKKLYNEKGLIIKENVTGTNVKSSTVNIKYKYDSKGNWILRIATLKEKGEEFTILTEREINYFSQGNTTNNAQIVTRSRAEFPGGTKALYEYIGSHIIYPPEAQESGTQGRVTVTFIVSKEDGSIKNARILRGADIYLDKEALRLVNSMPNWLPAKEDDEQQVVVMFRLT